MASRNRQAATEAEVTKTYPLGVMLRAFVPFYRPHRKLFYLDMACALVVSLLDLVYPMLTREVLDHVIPTGQLNRLVWLCVGLFAIYLVKAGLSYFMQYYGHVVGVRMQADMRRKIFSKLEKLPFSYFDNHKTGQIMSRIVNDLMDISELAHHGPEDLFLSLVMIIGSAIYLWFINWQLTVALLLFLPVIVLFSARRRLKMQDAFAASRKQVGEINANLENSINGIRVSKSFCTADHDLKNFEVSNQNFVKERGKAYQAMGSFFAGNSLILDLMNVLLLAVGGYLIAGSQLELADFLMYVLYIGLWITPVRKLVTFAEMYTNATTGFSRYLELMDAKEEVEPQNPKALPVPFRGEICLEDVSFSYETGGEVLSHLNLTIPSGKTVALVGPSGGGKTTLCHLIPRFYLPTGGRILLDGVDIAEVSLTDLRRKIGIVQQDVFLFGGTVAENIAYGKPDATMEEIAAAAKLAHLDEFIEALPDGYDTQVGERGIKLSGGQRQRISIARAFLKNPPILILDEATSALDTFTELAISHALKQLSVGRTTLVVAHRLSTVRNADCILVLDETGVVEQGTHAQLLQKGGMYAKLYQVQFADQQA